MNDNPLIALAGYFALLSLFAVGGANAAIPEMHRIAVEVMHWMSDRQFADSFAISQVSPGPNIIIVTLIGYHVAGLAGAAVATAAYRVLVNIVPAQLFCYHLTRAKGLDVEKPRTLRKVTLTQ